MNSQIVIIAEDGQIRNVKILTLIAQVALEVLSLSILVWLQMQRHSVTNFTKLRGRFWDVLFRIPEKYQCDIGAIREHTYFNANWTELRLMPCNNGSLLFIVIITVFRQFYVQSGARN